MLQDEGWGVNAIVTLLIEFSTYTSGSVKTIYFLVVSTTGVPVQGDMNNEVGSRCFHRMWTGNDYIGVASTMVHCSYRMMCKSFSKPWFIVQEYVQELQ